MLPPALIRFFVNKMHLCIAYAILYVVSFTNIYGGMILGAVLGFLHANFIINLPCKADPIHDV